MLDELLHNCGMTRSERQVLLELIHLGSATAAPLAKRLEMKRSTLYGILDSLVTLGLVTKERSGSATRFSAISTDLIPEVLENHAQRKYEAVQSAARLLPTYFQEIASSTEHNIGGFEITRIDSVELVYTELEQTILSGDFCAIFNPQTACVGRAREVMLRFLKKASVSKPHIREIAVSGPATEWYKDNISNKNHLVKELPAATDLLSDIILSNGLAFITHYEPKQEKSIKIVHPVFFRSMMVVFDKLWDGI